MRPEFIDFIKGTPPKVQVNHKMITYISITAMINIFYKRYRSMIDLKTV